MLFAAGATDRLGSTANGSSIGDSSPESRQRGGSTELNLYNFEYLGDDFAIIDIPGSIGFSADGAKALAIADVAIVVVDPDPARAPLAAPALRALDELGIPHLIFVNRIDQAHGRRPRHRRGRGDIWDPARRESSLQPSLSQRLLDGADIIRIVQLAQRKGWRRNIDDGKRNAGSQETQLFEAFQSLQLALRRRDIAIEGLWPVGIDSDVQPHRGHLAVQRSSRQMRDQPLREVEGKALVVGNHGGAADASCRFLGLQRPDFRAS